MTGKFCVILRCEGAVCSGSRESCVGVLHTYIVVVVVAVVEPWSEVNRSLLMEKRKEGEAPR